MKTNLVAVDIPPVFVSPLKPSEDGQATIPRLCSVSDKPETAKLTWLAGQPKSIRHCLADEEADKACTHNQVVLLPSGIATLRLEN